MPGAACCCTACTITARRDTTLLTFVAVKEDWQLPIDTDPQGSIAAPRNSARRNRPFAAERRACVYPLRVVSPTRWPQLKNWGHAAFSIGSALFSAEPLQGLLSAVAATATAAAMALSGLSSVLMAAAAGVFTTHRGVPLWRSAEVSSMRLLPPLLHRAYVALLNLHRQQAPVLQSCACLAGHCPASA